MGCKNRILLGVFFILINVFLVIANNYTTDIYFTVPSTVYTVGERIEIKGYINLTNFLDNGTLVTSSFLSNASVNLTIRNKNNSVYVNQTNFTTDANGSFYSQSNYYSSASIINAPSIPADYYMRAEYIDPNNITILSDVEIKIVNQTIDLLRVSPAKASYNPSESIEVEVEAIRKIGDQIIYVTNISVNVRLRNSSSGLISSFNCTTGQNGKCMGTFSAPTSYGNYIIEAENYKAFSAFSVIPFSFNIYMKDDTGKSLKNVFALSEQARIEVRVSNASSSDSYSFSGYIYDSSGNVVKVITSTVLNNGNNFVNNYLFTVDALTFNYGAYTANVNITNVGGGSITSLTSFKVKDWILSINKKTVNSGFEYEYSSFSNKTLRFEAFPTYRSNGSVIPNISSSLFSVYLKDDLNNIVNSTNVSWNSSCGNEGCYEFTLTSPLNTGQYNLYLSLTQGGDSQTESRVITVLDGVMSAQSTDIDGNIKELFGINEYPYLSLTSYNLSDTQINLTDAEIFLITFMNGTEISYTQVDNYSMVNSSDSTYQWAWNVTSQRIKIDVPKFGGVYNVYVFGDNRTVGTSTKFIVNPYEACSAAKDTAGQVVSGTNYYIWQFKTTDTIYFEIKLIQANNPLGKASVANISGSNSSSTAGSACLINSQTQQVVSNATLSVIKVTNLESGVTQSLNLTESTCQATNNNGTYTCTVKPLSKWEGGPNIVEFDVVGQDGTSASVYSRFESRAFYLYGWSNTWQNSPTDNITLGLSIYEAGNGWWSGSSGLSGTVTVKKIEYMGRDGEWLWPPVDSGYNVSKLNSSTITTGSGSISIPSEYASEGQWKTGNYRLILQATTTAGDTDYGYVWFGVKLWDVYGTPIECDSTGCNYKNYFNSKDNISLFIKISKAGNYNYYDSGGSDIWGNTTIGIKKIQDCRTWPCKDLNSSDFSANSLLVNSSSPWYWNANLSLHGDYILYINKTSGTWNTGYYNVILDINETDSGYAWFNTIAFYVETQPTNSDGTNYKYSIRGNSPMYFNISTVRSYKTGNSYWNGSQYITTRYNASDYINTTIDDITLRTWNQQTWESIEYSYPEDLNYTPLTFNGTGVLNITYLNGTWPSGYYHGEVNLKNSDNETSSGWLWMNVQPFRVQINTNSYSVDSDQCVNSTIFIYDSDWSNYSYLAGNFSVNSVYEDTWDYNSRSQTIYSNFSNVSFNATTSISICPNNGSWGSGSWGGYHSLNVIVKDNVYNDTQTGWISFNSVPFQISWAGGGGNFLSNQQVELITTVTKPSTGLNTTGNLTRLYQWRYDNGMSTLEEYIFSVGSCFSNVSSQCIVNGTQNVTIYPPSDGWRIGYNYLQTEWTESDDSTSIVQDNSGIYFEGREYYNGYFYNSDINGYYKYDFVATENLTINLNVRDYLYNSADVNITGVSYSSSENCWSEWCRSYTGVSFSPTTTLNGSAILKLQKPSGGWATGYYYIKATISGSGGTATVIDGNLRVKDMVAPNATITSPVNNGTYNGSISFSASTTESSQCSINVYNYDNFNSWYCGELNGTNATNGTWTSQDLDSCNVTKFSYSGSSYYNDYISSSYHSSYDGNTSTYGYGSFLTTGGVTHTYTINVGNYTDQDYGIIFWCYDEDYNYGTSRVAFSVNNV
ncbi:hypothetical protein GOV12_07270 [Candidatus Pacearchaeota archaeon]|nr:hypothetical protein [Candidatus Pacearchaeota archaeon]